MTPHKNAKELQIHLLGHDIEALAGTFGKEDPGWPSHDQWWVLHPCLAAAHASQDLGGKQPSNKKLVFC